MQSQARLERVGRRPVIGQDIVNIQNCYSLTLLDITFLMGNYGGRFYKLVTPENLGKPIRSVSRCLLVRFITDLSAEGRGFPVHQNLFHWPLMVPRPVSPKMYDETVQKHQSFIEGYWPGYNEGSRGILLGLSGSRATDRWIDESAPRHAETSTPHPIVQRLMTYLVADIWARGEKALLEHMQRVELEAHARQHIGIDEVLLRNRWNSVDSIEDRERTSAKKRRNRVSGSSEANPGLHAHP